jgi:hypothetical protein
MSTPVENCLREFARVLEASKQRVNLLTRMQRQIARLSVVLYPKDPTCQLLVQQALLVARFSGGTIQASMFHAHPRLAAQVCQRLLHERLLIKTGVPGHYYSADSPEGQKEPA